MTLLEVFNAIVDRATSGTVDLPDPPAEPESTRLLALAVRGFVDTHLLRPLAEGKRPVTVRLGALAALHEIAPTWQAASAEDRALVQTWFRTHVLPH